MTEGQVECLAELYRSWGELTPRLVVEAAADDTSPLHSLFTWDDTVAAQAFREEQARHVIRSVRVVITTSAARISTVAYIRNPLRDGGAQGYTSCVDLREDQEGARMAMRYECRRVLAQLRRARHLALALEVVQEFDDLIERIEGLHLRV